MKLVPLLLVTLVGCRYPAPKTSFLVIKTDDQRADTLWAMPIVMERLAAEGVLFTDAHVTVPMCCPERTSFLSGGWHPTRVGVLTNETPNGGFGAFRDSNTLPRRLQEAGWATGLFGKYLNGLEYDPLHVPPGWTRWDAITAKDGWDHVEFTTGSTLKESAEGESAWREGYVIDLLEDDVLAFLDAHPDEPFFAYVTPPSPHAPAEPAAEDVGAFADWQAWQGPAFNEADVGDKPAWVQEGALLDEHQVADLSVTVHEQVESLIAVDRLVGTLIEALESRGRLDETLIVFTSDNGYFWGEHRLEAKGAPYAEAVKVPLVVRLPGGLAGAESADLAAVNLDLAATILDLAGFDERSDGTSLVSAVRDGNPLGRDRLLIEGFGGDRPVWSAAVTPRWKFVTYETGETELYDRAADPHELTSLASAPPADADTDALAEWLADERGLAITTRALDTVAAGGNVDVTLSAWGGLAPLTWSATGLPDGVTLSTDGRLTGAPSEIGTFVPNFSVTDSSVSPWSGRAQSYDRPLRLVVGEASAVMLEPPTVRSAGPGSAEVVVRLRGSGQLTLRWGGNAAMDLLPHTLGPIDAGEGEHRLPMDDLRGGAVWELWLDGERVATGRVKPAR